MKKCDCGGETAKTTHADWCSIRKKSTLTLGPTHILTKEHLGFDPGQTAPTHFYNFEEKHIPVGLWINHHLDLV